MDKLCAAAIAAFVIAALTPTGAGATFPGDNRMRTNGTRLIRLTNKRNRFEFDADWQPVL